MLNRFAKFFLLFFATTYSFLTSQALPAEIRGEAYWGEPFGVGCLEVPLEGRVFANPLGPRGLLIRDRQGRILYPAIEYQEPGPILEATRGLLAESRRPVAQLAAELIRPSSEAKVYFLFRGDKPLEITLGPEPSGIIRLACETSPRRFRRLLARWWECFGEWQQPLMRGLPEENLLGEFFPYLQLMLADRLNLALPSSDLFEEDELPEWWTTQRRIWGQINPTEMLPAVWIAYRQGPAEPAKIPLPAIEFPPLDPASQGSATGVNTADISVEPIATRVPAECLYIRFGTFQSFLWFQDRLATWGGDFESLLTLRGQKSVVKQRIERSLLLKQSALSRLLGPALIADVAIVAYDLYLQEGASFGLLFHARNDFLLGAELTRQRQQELKSDPSLREEIVPIHGKKVSLITSDDGQVRSFYISENGFHLVTRSKRLAERFLEVGSGSGSLAESPAFQYFRREIPPEDDAIFLCISPQFLELFHSPHYRIETWRRAQAMTDIRLIGLATLAAKAEAHRATTIDDLIKGGFLPRYFGRRSDASHAVQRHETWCDSLRGHLGALVPVADLLPQQASAAELRAYQRFREELGSGSLLQPLALRMKPKLVGSQQEQIAFEIRLLSDVRSGPLPFRKLLGPPIMARIIPQAADAIAGEVVLGDRWWFWGIRGMHWPLPLGGDKRLLPMGGLREAVTGYLGSAALPRQFEAVVELAPSSEVPLRSQNPNAPPAPPNAASPAGGNPDLFTSETPSGEVSQASVVDDARQPDGNRPQSGPSTAHSLGSESPQRGSSIDGEPPATRILLPANSTVLTAGRLGLWTAESDGVQLWSFQPDILANLVGRIRWEPADFPAQVRLQISDLAARPAAGGFNQLAYRRAVATTLNNLRFLHQLAEQFRLDPQQVIPHAHWLVGSELICPLGGTYKSYEASGGMAFWSSSALPAGPVKISDAEPPSGFTAPPLNWFRGLNLSARLGPEAAAIHGVVLMEVLEAQAKPETPERPGN